MSKKNKRRHKMELEKSVNTPVQKRVAPVSKGAFVLIIIFMSLMMLFAFSGMIFVVSLYNPISNVEYSNLGLKIFEPTRISSRTETTSSGRFSGVRVPFNINTITYIYEEGEIDYKYSNDISIEPIAKNIMDNEKTLKRYVVEYSMIVGDDERVGYTTLPSFLHPDIYYFFVRNIQFITALTCLIILVLFIMILRLRLKNSS